MSLSYACAAYTDEKAIMTAIAMSETLMFERLRHGLENLSMNATFSVRLPPFSAFSFS